MKSSRATMAQHRTAMLDAASRLFREHGIGAVAVADITRAAGLTHGAFYGHFQGKEALAAEAARTSMMNGAVAWRARADRAVAEGRCPVAAVVRPYLTEAHRDAPQTGCALATIGQELSRTDGALHDALREGVEALLAALDAAIAMARPELDAPARERAGLAALAAMNGGLILARALADHPARSAAALDAAATAAISIALG